MSVLTIAEDAAERVGARVPSTVINNANKTAVLLKAFIKKEVKTLLRKHDWNEVTITALIKTQTNKTCYKLPDCYLRPIEESYWDRSNNLPMASVSPLSMVVWLATPSFSRSRSGSNP